MTVSQTLTRAKRDSSGTPTVEILRGGIDVIDSLAQEWRDLCLEGVSNEPFYRPEWIAAYVRAFEAAHLLTVICARVRGRLRAVLPVIEEQAFFCGLPARKLRGAANVHSYRFDLVRGADRDGEAGVEAMWHAISQRGGWDVVELPDVPEGGCAEQLLLAAHNDGFPTGRWETIRSPYISLMGVKDPMSIPHRAHFRQNLRRRLKKAQSQWGVTLCQTRKADPLTLRSFLDLENSGWKGEGRTSILSGSATRQFYNEIASIAERFGYFSLSLLKFGDSPVAGHFGLIYDGRYYTPKVAYDETYSEYGPGHLMLHAVLQEYLKRGVSRCDFLGPWMPWKAEWASGEQKHSVCYIFQRGCFGQTLKFAKLKVMTALRKMAHAPLITHMHGRHG